MSKTQIEFIAIYQAFSRSDRLLQKLTERLKWAELNGASEGQLAKLRGLISDAATERERLRREYESVEKPKAKAKKKN